MSATRPAVSDRRSRMSVLLLPGAGVLVALGLLFLLVAHNTLVGSVVLAVGVADTVLALTLRRTADASERRTDSTARPVTEEH
jgi:hypothetical protein